LHENFRKEKIENIAFLHLFFVVNLYFLKSNRKQTFSKKYFKMTLKLQKYYAKYEINNTLNSNENFRRKN